MKPVPFITLCLLTGCLARPHLDKQSFIFAPPALAALKPAAGDRVLAIRNLEIAQPFQGRAFVYRTGDFSYDRDPYAEFMTPPADALAAPICARWRQAGPFSDVIEAGSARKPNTLVEIQVSQLYGDFRPPADPNAVLAMRFVFFDAPGGLPGKVVMEKEYSRQIPLTARTADALIEGWNQALAQIVDSAAQDFEQSDAAAPKP